MHHFGASPITAVFFLEEIRVIEFFPDLSFTIIVNFKAELLQIYMGCHRQCGHHYKVHGKGFILVQVLSRQHNLTGRYVLLNWSLFADSQNLVNFQSSVAQKPMGGHPHKCTSLESAVFLLSSNASPSFIARCVMEQQLLKVPSSWSC